MSNFEKNLEQALINAKRLTDKILIDGKLVSAQSKNKIPVLNPSTGDNIGSAPQCNKDDVNIAVESAHKAFQKLKFELKIEIEIFLQAQHAVRKGACASVRGRTP